MDHGDALGGAAGSGGRDATGWWCGLGTGLAYAASNVPAVFEARPETQTILVIVGALVGTAAAFAMKPEAGGPDETADYNRVGKLKWGVIFLALVWLDSAGFYVLQHTRELKDVTWRGPWTLYGNAATHLFGAVLAGWALDARRLGATALVAVLLLATADALLGFGAGGASGAQVFYTLGVSAYSVALVYYPAFGARPWLAAGLFAVAGWLGSALGIGMVQDLHVIPAWFIVVAGVTVLVALAGRRGPWSSPRVAVGIVVGGLCALVGTVRGGEPDSVRGRKVYIAEGCINCHSQFLRPGVRAEILWWGPARPLASSLADQPPLLGLRRQGPDLTNVGNRRSPDWQRLHLIAPGEVTPGSRMPSYAQLFKDGDERGEALVAYLVSLGAETLPVRLEQSAAWRPSASAEAKVFATEGARSEFNRLCAACHGAEGRGDGRLAGQLAVRPPDFRNEAWRHVRAEGRERVIALARIIKFGVPGTAMAGREYLDDDTVVMLARYVMASHR